VTLVERTRRPPQRTLILFRARERRCFLLVSSLFTVAGAWVQPVLQRCLGAVRSRVYARHILIYCSGCYPLSSRSPRPYLLPVRHPVCQILSRGILSIVIVMTVTMEQSYETRVSARLPPVRVPYSRPIRPFNATHVPSYDISLRVCAEIRASSLRDAPCHNLPPFQLVNFYREFLWRCVISSHSSIVSRCYFSHWGQPNFWTYITCTTSVLDYTERTFCHASHI